MNDKKSILKQIWDYIIALGRIGQVLTLLGLIPTIIDIISPIVNINIQVPSLISIIWFLLAFGIANFRIFRQQRNLDFEIRQKEYSFSIGDWHDWEDKKPFVKPEFIVNLHSELGIYNHNTQKPIDLQLSLKSVDTNWVLSKELSKIEVKINRQQVQNGNLNPFMMRAGEINDKVFITLSLPFKVPNREAGFEYLGSLKKLIVFIEFEQSGNQFVELKYECKTSNILKTIEDKFSFLASNSDQRGNIHFIKSMKQFWSVKEE